MPRVRRAGVRAASYGNRQLRQQGNHSKITFVYKKIGLKTGLTFLPTLHNLIVRFCSQALLGNTQKKDII